MPIPSYVSFWWVVFKLLHGHTDWHIHGRRGAGSRRWRVGVYTVFIQSTLNWQETLWKRIQQWIITWFGHWRTTGSHTEWYIATYITGNRSRRRQRKTWMDNVKEDLRTHNIDIRDMWLIWRETEQYGGIVYKLIVTLLGLPDGREKKPWWWGDQWSFC